jgi:HK97 family phage major capsid protein
MTMDEAILEKAMERFDGAIGKFEAKQSQRIDELQDRIDSWEEKAATAGTVGKRRDKAESKALRSFIANGEFDQSVLKRGEAKSLSLGGGSDILQPEHIAAQIEKFAKDSSALMGLVRNTSSSTGDYRRIARVTPPVAAWSTETGTRSDQDEPEYRAITPLGGELYGVYTLTNWLLNDSQFPLEAEMAEEFGLQVGRALDSAILTGTGTNGQIKGIMDEAPVTTNDFASPLRDADALEYVVAPSPDDLLEHMLSTLFTLNPVYRRNATWIMSSATLATVRNLRINSNPAFTQNYGTGQDQGDGTLLGKPVVCCEFMDAEGLSPLGFPIAVGDWNAAYELVSIGRPSLIVDRVTSKGSTKLYHSQRYLGRLINNDAIKLVTR